MKSLLNNFALGLGPTLVNLPSMIIKKTLGIIMTGIGIIIIIWKTN